MKRNLTVKEMPPEERPYEKCLNRGADALSDAELIAALIRTGSAGEKSIDLAHRILNAGPDRVLNILYLNADQLMQIRGVGAAKAAQLKCAAELAGRISSARRARKVRLSDPGSIAAYYMESLRHKDKENLVLSMYNADNLLIADETLSVGTSNMALITPAQVYKSALFSAAEYIVLLHNHPSGNPAPSQADISVTKQVKECGRVVGIPLMDHIIIGDNCYYSFRAEGII